MRPSAGSFDEAVATVEKLSGWKSLLKLFASVNWFKLEEHVFGQENSMSTCIASRSTEVCQNSLISGVSMTGINGTSQRELFELLFNDPLPPKPITTYSSVLSAPRTVMTVGIILSQIDGGPVSVLTQDLFKRVNKQRIRVVCFLLQSPENVRVQWQLNMLASFGPHGVVSLQGLTPAAAADVIAHHRIDVLVDMNGLSLHSGLPIMAYRPAPVQMSFLGDPFTSGMRFVDLFVSDPRATPPDSTASHFTEKLVLLPSCYLVNSHAAWLPNVPSSQRFDKSQLITQVHDSAQYEDPASDRHFDPDTSVLLGAFHGFVKIDPTIMHVWTNVLRRCGGGQQCYLTMNNNKDMAAMRNLQLIAQHHGVSGHNLLFLNQSSWNEHLTRKSALDLFLDTSLKNGHTTTIDAVYAGLPVIGLRGMAGAHQRSTESVAHHLSSEAGLSFSLKQYEDLAAGLTATARGRQRLAAWRAHSERMRTDSSLFDTQHFADGFSDLLQATVDLRAISDRMGDCGGRELQDKCKWAFHVFASRLG